MGFNDEVDAQGGRIAALGHSTMGLSGGYSGVEFVTDPDSEISICGDGGLTDANRGEIRGSLYPNGPTTIVNQGHMDLQYVEAQNSTAELSFAGAGTVILDASTGPVELRGPIRNISGLRRRATSHCR